MKCWRNFAQFFRRWQNLSRVDVHKKIRKLQQNFEFFEIIIKFSDWLIQSGPSRGYAMAVKGTKRSAASMKRRSSASAVSRTRFMVSESSQRTTPRSFATDPKTSLNMLLFCNYFFPDLSIFELSFSEILELRNQFAMQYLKRCKGMAIW